MVSSSVIPFAPVDPLSTPVVPSAATVSPSPTAGWPDSGASPEPLLPAQPVSDARQGYRLHVHPDGAQYVGDRISLEVFEPAEGGWSGQTLSLLLDGLELGQAEFVPGGLDRRARATFPWVWDTAGLLPGAYELTFSLAPNGPIWTEAILLLPERSLPANEKAAHWETVETACCQVNYLTGTDAERDLALLLPLIDAQAHRAAERLGADLDGLEEPVVINLLPKVIGHGGFASQAITLSYLDRNYTGSDFAMVVHHELVHILDGQAGGELHPTILAEGLAVYLSGGHFKPEDLLPRAAALLERPGGLNRYLPLRELADHFYPAQHEIGYLQAGALVAFMVENWGWEAFDSFYRDIHPVSDGSQAAAIENALQRHFGLDLAELDEMVLAALSEEAIDPHQRENLRLTVLHFDTLRRYQRICEPSAYFMSAWLPDMNEMRRQGIVADALRRPLSPGQGAVEALLLDAVSFLDQGLFAQAEAALADANAVLESLERIPEPEAGGAAD